MAADERDATFEKALARQLRGGGAPGDLRGATANCLEAEILGAYYERSLTAGEMAECATHLAGCARCREILSQLEATDEVAMGTVAEEDARQVRDLPALPILVPVPKKSSRIAMRYWVAPLGAIAAGLLVWIAVEHQQEARQNQKATAEVALNREYAPLAKKVAPPADAGAGKMGSTSLEDGARSRDDLLAQKKESTGRDEKSLAKELPTTNLRAAAPRMASPGKPLAKAEARGGIGYGVGGGVGVSSGAGIGAGSAGDKILPPAGMTESVEVTAEARAVNGATDAAPKPAAAPPPPRMPAMTQTVTVEGAAPAVAQNQTVEVTSDAKSIQSLPIEGRNVSDLVLLAPGAAQISAPGTNILWRLGRGGRIENSKDSGAHWKKQKSHVKADLSSGFAPSAEICWIVGSAGTILRSVDGGAHWKKVASPLAGEIAGISAMDALHATVWDVDKKKMFVTADGGISWSAVAQN